MVQNPELTNQDKCYHNSPPKEILNPMQNLVVAILSSGLKYYPYSDSPLPAPPFYIHIPNCLLNAISQPIQGRIQSTPSNLLLYWFSEISTNSITIFVQNQGHFFPSNPSPYCQLRHQKRYPDSDVSLQLPTQSRLSPSLTQMTVIVSLILSHYSLFPIY